MRIRKIISSLTLLALLACDNRLKNTPDKKEIDQKYSEVAKCMNIEDAAKYRQGLSIDYIKKHSHSTQYVYMTRHAIIHYFTEQTTGNPQDNHKYPFSFRCEFI